MGFSMVFPCVGPVNSLAQGALILQNPAAGEKRLPAWAPLAGG